MTDGSKTSDGAGASGAADESPDAPLTGETRVLEAAWPFLYSVINGRGLVKNLPVGSKAPSKTRTPTLREELRTKGIAGSTSARRRVDQDEEPVRKASKGAVTPIALNWAPAANMQGAGDD